MNKSYKVLGNLILLLAIVNMAFVQYSQAQGLSELSRMRNRFLQDNDQSNNQIIHNCIPSVQGSLNQSDTNNEEDLQGQNNTVDAQESSASGALPANTSDVNLTILESKIKDQYAGIFYQNLRIEGHIITDKVVYRPDDVMFVEVIVVDAFNKSLINLDSFQEFYYQLMFNMEIRDGSDTKIHSSSAMIENSTIGFTFKIPQDQSGGQYKIMVYNQNMPTAERLIDIRSYNRQLLLVQASFDKESYSPGDRVSGTVQVNRTDGVAFTNDDSLSFSLVVNFGVSDFSISDQDISSSDGSGQFTFKIPANIEQLVTTLAFTVKYNDMSQVYSTTIIVGQPEKIVVDFATETNQFVYNVVNKIYFQAFASEGRADIVDFSGASLKSEVIIPPSYYDYSTFSTYNYFQMPPVNQNQTNSTVIDGSISTEHRGKGEFVFTPQPFYSYYLEIPLGNDTAYIDLPFYSSYRYPIPIDPYPMPVEPDYPIGGPGPVVGPAVDFGPIMAGGAADVADFAVASPPNNAAEAVAAIGRPVVNDDEDDEDDDDQDEDDDDNIGEPDGAGTDPNVGDTTTSTYIPPTDQSLIYPPIYSNPNEISFTILNEDKVLDNDEDLELQFMTNQILNYQMNYIVVIQMKEKIILAQALNFQAMKNYSLTIPAEKFPALNGGVFQVSLYLANNMLYSFFNSGDLSSVFSNPQFSLSLINPLFYNKGEILFFKKPSITLSLEIETDKETYQPGDKVEFTVTISDSGASDDEDIGDVFISLCATDDSVFNQIKESQLPGSLPSLVYLENEVDKSYSQFFLYANEYLNHLYDESATNSTDRNLELLLGVQSWRFGYFFYPNIQDLNSAIYSMSEQNQTIISNLFGYPFVPNYGGDGGFDGGFGMPMPMQMGGVVADGMAVEYMAAAVPAPTPANAGGADAASGAGSASGSATSASSGNSGSNNDNDDDGKGSQAQSSSGSSVIEFDGSSIISDFMRNITENTRNYSHALRENYVQGDLVDMTETLFYSSSIQVKKARNAMTYKGSFFLSDLITQFRLSANAFSSQGVFGFAQYKIQSLEDFYLQVSLPTSMVTDDVLQIPVTIFNNLDQELTLSEGLSVQSSEQILSFEQDSNNADSIAPGEQLTLMVTFTALKAFRNQPVVFTINAENEDGDSYNASVTKFVNVIPKGFPLSLNQGGFIGVGIGMRNVTSKADFLVTIPESLEEGSISFTGKVFSSNFATLTEAVASLIKQPSGCFEQISATTYPLTMGLNFLKSMPDQTPEVQDYIAQSTSTLANGYSQLVDYKTTENGYEWFGASPASEVLTAYGYMQFTDMQQNTDFVDNTMMNQAINWLMSRADPSGGFLMNPLALDSFGRAPKNVTDAYIIWALTSGSTQVDGLETQIEYLKNLADQSITDNNIDTYYLSLVAAILYNVNRTDDARTYADLVAQFQQATGRVTNSFYTITMSEGKNLNIETTALAAVAWLSDQDRYSEEIELAIEYIVSLVDVASYGTTQATVLSLKAITKYMNNFVDINGEGDFVLYVNGEEADRVAFTPEKKDAITFDIADYILEHQDDIFIPGSQVNFSIAIDNYTQDTTIEDPFADTQILGFKLSYSMSMQYYDERPPSGNASLDFSIQMNETDLLGSEDKLGQIFTYDLEIKNKRANKALLMVVARFRIPSCLEVNFQMLNDLKNNQLIDFYEVLNGNTEIAIYWRQFMQGESKRISLDFVQAFVGECYQQPSDAYVYYNNDQPIYWIYY